VARRPRRPLLLPQSRLLSATWPAPPPLQQRSPLLLLLLLHRLHR
jgi:hypothetical protein